MEVPGELHFLGFVVLTAVHVCVAAEAAFY